MTAENNAAAAWRNVAQHDVRGFTETQTATIAAHNLGKVFYAATKGLYSEPIPSMVRELICNALDETPHAGGKPLRVDLPTMLSPQFVVRDYGRGMSHEFMMARAMSLGESTKEADNAALGKFGYGLKVPFALVDQFSILIYRGAFVQTYVCDLAGEHGMPRVMTGPDMCKPLATHETGTEIRVPMGTTELYKIRDALQRFLAQVNPALYSVPGFTITPQTWTRETPDFNTFADNSESFILLGPVRYPVNWEAIGMRDNHHNAFGGRNVAFKFQGGELQVTPNREQVRYTPETIQAIKDKLALVRQHIERECAGTMKACTTRLEAWRARCKLARDFGSLFPGVHWGTETYSELDANPAFDASKPEGKDNPRRVNVEKVRPWKVPDALYIPAAHYWSHTALASYKSPKSAKDSQVILTSYRTERVAWYENDVASNRLGARMKIAAAKNTGVELHAIIEPETARAWGLGPLVKLSTLEPPKPAPRASGKITTGERQAFRYDGPYSYRRQSVRVDLGGCYVPFHKGEPFKYEAHEKLMASAYAARFPRWGLPDAFRSRVDMTPWKDAATHIAGELKREHAANRAAIAYVRSQVSPEFSELVDYAATRGETPSARFNALRKACFASAVGYDVALVQTLIAAEDAGLVPLTPAALRDFAKDLKALRNAQPVFDFCLERGARAAILFAALTVDK